MFNIVKYYQHMQVSALRIFLLNIGKTIARFPFVVLFATTGAVLLAKAQGLPHTSDGLHSSLTRIAMALYLGMLAAIFCKVFCEKVKLNITKQILLNLIIVLLMYLYYRSLQVKPGYVDQSRFVVLLLGLHAGIAFAPFITSGNFNGFWQYNKHLLFRITTAFIYSHILFIGLWLALLAIDNLFGLQFNDVNYGRLYILVLGIFNTMFFLYAFPQDVASLEQEKDFPKSLSIFTRFILLPLVTVYLLILYTYSIKIIFTQTWPAGWVSYLVIGFSVVGILAMLLVWPLRNDEKQKWVTTYTRYFYIALLPLIILLSIAIGKRVMQYGLTEERYFVIMIACWLILIDLYFMISLTKNIKIIPVSIFIFCVIAAYGPFSAYKTSEESQLRRLTDLLQEAQRLSNGKAVKSNYQVPMPRIKEISSAAYYLIFTHGLSSMQPLFSNNLDSLCSVNDSSDIYIFKPTTVLNTIGIEYSNPHDNGSITGNVVNLNVKDNNVILTKDFDYLVTFNVQQRISNNKNMQVFYLGDRKSVV